MVNGKLNLNGYYHLDKPNYVDKFTLYPDGTVGNFIFYDNTYIGKPVTNLDSLIYQPKNPRKPYLLGGIYKVVGDTLTTCFYYNSIFPEWLWRRMFNKYRIIDKNSLIKTQIESPGN